MEKPYTLKTSPADFVVEEVMHLALKEHGNFMYVQVQKENMTSEEARQLLAKSFHIEPKHIAYSGLKDKRAQTTQVFSIEHASKNAVLAFQNERLGLQFLGYGDEPVYLGNHTKNKLTITVHFTGESGLRLFEEGVSRIEQQPLLVNYFDEQRFSTRNVDVGVSLLKKDFKKATEVLMESANPELDVQQFLEENPTNHVGALSTLPMATLSIYVHAVQSAIFNTALAKFIKVHATEKNQQVHEVLYSQGMLAFPDDLSSVECIDVPLIGFGLEELEGKERFMTFISDEMSTFGINERDFISRQLPAISAEAKTRAAAIRIEAFTVVEKTPEKAILSFILEKGSYATMLFKQLFFA